MDGPRLSITHLAAGDVLLLEDMGEATHLGIAAAQAMLCHHVHASANVTHAGLYDVDDLSIVEASGAAGLRRMPLARKHHGYKFQCYRYKGDSRVPAKAVEVANVLTAAKLKRQAEKLGAGRTEVLTSKGAENYDTMGCFIGGGLRSSSYGDGAKAAITALKAAYDAGSTGDVGFYCSNFVVACYQLAELLLGGTADTISAIKLDYRHVSPKRLQGFLRDGNWRYVGNYRTDPEDVFTAVSHLWSPAAFEEHTYHWSKRPSILKQIKLALENYHGLPYSADNVPTRCSMLVELGGLTARALGEDINATRKVGLQEFQKQINYEMAEWSTQLG